MKIADSTIDKVREADIVDIISRYVKLKQKGDNYQGCCPFHNEKSPSFMVSAKKRLYKCFGCGKGGNDAIGFVMQHDGLEFPEAVLKVAELAGITVEYKQGQDSEAHTKRHGELKGLREYLRYGQDYFTQALQSNPEALAYAEERGLNAEVRAIWGIGYAPNVADVLVLKYRNAGTLPQAEKCGLLSRKEEKEDKYYDTFRNRLMFAITNEQNELVSFAGRRMPGTGQDKYAKYINGRQTPLYDKSKTLYGMYQAIPAIKEQGYVTLVEGYLDVISMHSAGAANTVATCGTALTEEHLKLLGRYTKCINLMRDADAAGQKAVIKDTMLALQMGFVVDVTPLPAGCKDPDEFARTFITENAPEA